MCASGQRQTPKARTVSLDEDEVRESSTQDYVAIDKGELQGDLSDAPLLLRPWVHLLRSTPCLAKIPFLNLDVTFSICSGVFLHLIRIVVTPIMIKVVGWPEGQKDSTFAIGGVVAMVHALLLLPSLLMCLITQPYRPSATMASAPKWWQDASNALIQLCTGYMLQDSLITFVVENYVPGKGVQISASDVQFLGHHFITVSYMLSALYIGAGHLSAMILMFFGEFTNPIFNSFLMSQSALKLGCCGANPEMHEIIGIVYALQYAFFRLLVGPVITVHLTYDFLLTKRGRKNVPLALGLYWSVCANIVVIASLPWSIESVEMIKVFLNGGSITEMAS